MTAPAPLKHRTALDSGLRTIDSVRFGRPDVVAAALLFLASLVFYYPLVFLGRVVVDFDAFVYFYPQRAYLAQSLVEGRLPLWNPYLFMGAPFLANPQTAVLYPLSWLFLLGPVEFVYTVQLVLHTYLAALFTYLLARAAFGVGPLAALVGALAYAFGGFMAAQAGHLNQLSAAAWLPAVLLAYDQAVRRLSPAWAGLGALAFGMQLLAGHPQESYMTALVLVLFWLVRAPWRNAWRLAWAAFAGILVAGVGALVAAAQVLPTLELVGHSIRGTGVVWEDAVARSLPSYLVPRALMPPFWLNVASTEYVGYVGVTPVAMGFLALMVVRSRFVVFGALLCFIGLFLAPGENNGYYGLLFSTVPGFDTFRVPARWLFLWCFGAAVLSALGAEWIRQGAWVWLRRPDLWVRLVLVAFVLSAGLAWQRDHGEPFPQRRTPALWAAIAAAAIATGFLANLGYRRQAAGVLVALTAAELWAAAGWSPARQAVPASFLDSGGPAGDWLRAGGAERARVLSLARPDYIPRNEDELRVRFEGLPEHSVRSILVATKWRETLTPNLPLQYGLRSVDGYDGGVLPLRNFLRLSTLLVPPDRVRADGVLQSRLDAPPDDRLLDQMGVQYLLQNQETPPPPGTDARDLGNLRLYVRQETVPLSLLIFNAGTASDEEALVQMAQVSFDPNREVLLARDPRARPLVSEQPGQPVDPVVEWPETWRARVSTPAPSYLLQREAWYPGWRARVDGLEVPVFRANVLFRAVYLPPGDHDVEVFFDSAAFNQGGLLSLVGLAATGLLLIWPLCCQRLSIIRVRARS
jgi:hypothetical protein